MQNVTPSGMSFTLENPTKNKYLYTDEDILHVYKNNSWEYVSPIDINLEWNATAHILLPHSKIDVVTDWEWRLGELPDGDYKFQRQIYFGNPRSYHVIDAPELEFSLPSRA
jgi:hypothetical protein